MIAYQPFSSASPLRRGDAYAILQQQNDARLYALYTGLERHLNAGGQNMLSYNQISTLCVGVSASFVKRNIPRLCELGLLSRHRVGNGAYCWALTAPKVIPFAAPRERTMTPREVTQPPREVTQPTNMNDDDDDKGIELNTTTTLIEQTARTPQRAAILASIPDAGLPLLKMADGFDLKIVEEHIADALKPNVKNPAGYLTDCLRSARDIQKRPASQRPTRPGKRKRDQPIGGKYAAFIDQ